VPKPVVVAVKPKVIAKPAAKPVAPAATPVQAPAPAPAPAPVKTAQAQPTPIPAGQPAPGSGAKQLAPAPAAPPPGGGSTSPPPSGSGSLPAATGGYHSTNWSGYVATAGNYTAVSGSWIVPKAAGNGTTTTAESSWVGIGGVFAGDLIQTGTANTVAADGSVQTDAWYELLPNVALDIPSLAVSPGDSISASVSETSPGQWLITITDNKTGQSFSTTVSYVSSHSSAEWVEEDPSYAGGSQVPFANFGTVSFTNGSATAGGAAMNVSAANSKPITMVDGSNQPIATPSVLDAAGSGFNVVHN
jgi:hypothetical protein